MFSVQRLKEQKIAPFFFLLNSSLLSMALSVNKSNRSILLKTCIAVYSAVGQRHLKCFHFWMLNT